MFSTHQKERVQEKKCRSSVEDFSDVNLFICPIKPPNKNTVQMNWSSQRDEKQTTISLGEL